MDQLDRSPGQRGAVDRRLHHLGSGECEQGAYTLAAARCGIAHGGMQARRRVPGSRQHLLECPLGEHLVGTHPCLETRRIDRHRLGHLMRRLTGTCAEDT